MFPIGSLVVCVDAHKPGNAWLGDPLFKNNVYTVRGNQVDWMGNRGVLLEEASTKVVDKEIGEVGYRAERFRPIKKPDISSLLNVTKELEDV